MLLTRHRYKKKLCVCVVALHVARREEEHRCSSGRLPALTYTEDLQVPSPAQGTCAGSSPSLLTGFSSSKEWLLVFYMVFPTSLLHLSACVSIYLFIHPSTYLNVYLPMCQLDLCLFFYLIIFLAYVWLHVFVFLSVYVTVSISVCVPVSLFLCLHIFLSESLPVSDSLSYCQSVFPSRCQSVTVSLSVCVFKFFCLSICLFL